MFLRPTVVVKAVMVGLAFASVVTWTVWLVKSLEFAGAPLKAHARCAASAQAGSLEEAARTRSGAGRAGGACSATAALQEAALSADLVREGLVEGVKERIARASSASRRRPGGG